MRSLFLFTLNAMREKGYGTVNHFNSAHSQQIKWGETKRAGGWTAEKKKKMKKKRYATQTGTMCENAHDRVLKDDKRMRIR